MKLNKVNRKEVFLHGMLFFLTDLYKKRCALLRPRDKPKERPTKYRPHWQPSQIAPGARRHPLSPRRLRRGE